MTYSAEQLITTLVEFGRIGLIGIILTITLFWVMSYVVVFAIVVYGIVAPLFGIETTKSSWDLDED